MNRKPLDGRIELRFADRTVMYLDVSHSDRYDPVCLEYDAKGTFKGKQIEGRVLEYFPDDSPGMYYDIFREYVEIKIGYLSQKPFRNGCTHFCEYFRFLKSKAAPDSDSIRVTEANNTAYAYIDNSLSVKIGADYKNDLLKLADGAALLNKHGFRINCDIIAPSDDCYIPCGAYVQTGEDENLTDENIYSFGKAVFSFLFGRAPGIADCRFYSDWKRSEIKADADINDKDFEILKNLLRHTLQVTRRSCLQDFGKVRDELKKLR